MMRPMKLAGSELMFGEGSLAYIKTIKAKKVSIVIAHILSTRKSTGIQTRFNYCCPFIFRKIKNRSILQFDHAFHLIAIIRNTIHILAADRSDLFQRIDHTVYRRRSDTRILQRRLIINFLAAITFSFQNNIDQHEPLLRNPTATSFQLLDYSFFRVHDSPFPCCRLLGSDINYLKSCFLDSFFRSSSSISLS